MWQGNLALAFRREFEYAPRKVFEALVGKEPFQDLAYVG